MISHNSAHVPFRVRQSLLLHLGSILFLLSVVSLRVFVIPAFSFRPFSSFFSLHVVFNQPKPHLRFHCTQTATDITQSSALLFLSSLSTTSTPFSFTLLSFASANMDLRLVILIFLVGPVSGLGWTSLIQNAAVTWIAHHGYAYWTTPEPISFRDEVATQVLQLANDMPAVHLRE